MARVLADDIKHTPSSDGFALIASLFGTGMNFHLYRYQFYLKIFLLSAPTFRLGGE